MTYVIMLFRHTSIFLRWRLSWFHWAARYECACIPDWHVKFKLIAVSHFKGLVCTAYPVGENHILNPNQKYIILAIFLKIDSMFGIPWYSLPSVWEWWTPQRTYGLMWLCFLEKAKEDFHENTESSILHLSGRASQKPFSSQSKLR